MQRTTARRSLTTLFALVPLLMAAPQPVAAQVVVSTLGPDNSFQNNSGYTLASGGLAQSFVYSGPQGRVLDKLLLGLSPGSPGTTLIEFLRGTDMYTATTLVSWSNVNAEGFQPLGALFTFAATTDVPLISGETYWISVSRFGGVTSWSRNSVGIGGLASYKSPGSPEWVVTNLYESPAYAVFARAPGNASVVPEPTTVLLFGTGLFALGFVQRRRTR